MFGEICRCLIKIVGLLYEVMVSLSNYVQVQLLEN